MLFLIIYVENLWIVSWKSCLFSQIKNLCHYVYIYDGLLDVEHITHDVFLAINLLALTV